MPVSSVARSQPSRLAEHDGLGAAIDDAHEQPLGRRLLLGAAPSSASASRPPRSYAAAYSPSLLSMICRSRCASDAAVSTYVSTTIAIEPATNSVAYQSAEAQAERAKRTRRRAQARRT